MSTRLSNVQTGSDGTLVLAEAVTMAELPDHFIWLLIELGICGGVLLYLHDQFGCNW